MMNLADHCGCSLAGTCQICRLVATDHRYAELFGVAKVPQPHRNPRTLRCVNEWEGILESCPRGDEMLHVRGCDIHDKCTRQKCQTCNEYVAVTHYEIQTDGRGIGDAVSQLYACCGLADATGKPVIMRTRHHTDWFAGVSHPGLSIQPHDGTGVECNPDYPGQCRAADAGTVSTRCQWYCDKLSEALGVSKFAPVRPKGVVKPKPVVAPGYVVLAPFSLHEDRTWPAYRWRELTGTLHSMGKLVIAIDKPGDDARLREVFGSTAATWHWGQPPEWSAALIANADLLIGNDSGMAHIAGMYGTPGVVIMTMFPFPFVFGESPSLVAAGHHRQNLADVTVADALAKIDAVLNRGKSMNPTTLPKFYQLIQDRLGTPYANEMGRVDRDKTMGWLFRELESRFPDGPRIVETGCIRSREDWSAGYATWLFGTFIRLTGKGALVSVDNDSTHIAIASELCRGMGGVYFALADSAKWLQEYEGEPLACVYADSLDTWAPNCAAHGLAEAKAASRIVAPNGLIVFDDSPSDGKGGWQGKGREGIPWLCENDWRVRPESSYQTILERA